MKHPDEHTLELYVLNAESVAAQRTEIEEHLRSCAGCKSLLGEISEFYTELDQELDKADERAAASDEHQLMKRSRDLTLWEERLTMGPLTWRGTTVKKMRYYIRRYPIVAAGTTFAFAALAGIGSLMVYREVSRDVNPAYSELNSRSGFLEVYNKGNELLWKRIAQGLDVSINDQAVSEVPRHVVFDIDADGRSEVLTVLQLSGEPPVPNSGLHVFDGRGDFYDISFERRPTFRGTPYEMPVRIEGGSVIVIDSLDRDAREIFVTAKNERSPTAIVRMNNRGEILGEYWHHGQFPAVYSRDINGDGKAELFLCGFNDVDDATQPLSPVIIVLDPRKIVGKQESQVTRGYGYEKSDAELYYIKLPLTEINTYTHVGAGVSRMRVQDDRMIFLWGFYGYNNVRFDLDFVFSKSFEPLRVISATQITQIFEREYAQKHISTRMDDAYLDYLRSRIRFWDGKEWSRDVVVVNAALKDHSPAESKN